MAKKNQQKKSAKAVKKGTAKKAAPQKTVKAKPNVPNVPFFDSSANFGWAQGLALVVLAFGLYFASLSFGYVLDDTIVIVENGYVNPTDADYMLGDSTVQVKNPIVDENAKIPSFSQRIKKIFGTDSFMGYFKTDRKLLEGGRYRPLSLATFAAEHQMLGGLNPWVSHFLNILLYGLTGFLIYRVLLGLFPIKEGQNAWFNVAFFRRSLVFIASFTH